MRFGTPAIKLLALQRTATLLLLTSSPSSFAADIATGHLIAEYDPTVGPDNQPLARQNIPTWVEELNAKP
jgi:hypothetical protein